MKEIFSSILDDKSFWDTVYTLISLSKEQNIHHLAKELSQETQYIKNVIYFLRGVQCDLEIQMREQEEWIIPAKVLPQIEMKFSLWEWLQFQAHFPVIADKMKFYSSRAPKAKLAGVEEQYSEIDFFGSISVFEKLHELTSELKPNIEIAPTDLQLSEILLFLEESILDHQIVALEAQEKKYVLYPHQLVTFDEEISLIAENVEETSLIHIPLSEIRSVYEEEGISYLPQFSSKDVHEFIKGIREVDGSEIRLVLKVFSRLNFDTHLPYEYFGSPCLLTNGDGDYIWAASVEPSVKVFNWLKDLGNDVEIMSPDSFKKLYRQYVEETELKAS